MSDELAGWLARGDTYRVVIDFTGGTKCMSAAIALFGSEWPCTYAYVGGTQRTKGGTGTVTSGNEQVISNVNPWEALGFRAVAEFVSLFDSHAYGAAIALAERYKRGMTDGAKKREFVALEQLAQGMDAWDRFDHGTSRKALSRAIESRASLADALGRARTTRVLTEAKAIHDHLAQLVHPPSPSRAFVVDLLANATRRADERRFDDAVARLYRATEAIAQTALNERHGLASTAAIPLDRVPEPLRTE